ncbi:MAG TPA: EpsG family protein [Gammaproteobacteria bacterium]|nr:EpsG family protein [Gammaproteobacteria bacterium]
MWPYWVVYLLPAIAALLLDGRRKQLPHPWWAMGALLVLFVGYRHRVGGDWFNYIDHLARVWRVGIFDPVEGGDPGYVYVNRIVSTLGGDIYDVNLVAAMIFVFGLMIFCRSLPRPWLALAVAIPYIVVVVGMGYTRQAIALGLIMWGIVYLEKGKLVHYIAFVSAATLFHKTAVIMIPLGIFLQRRGWVLRVVAIGLVGLGLWNAFLVESQETLWKNYVVAQMQSEGARIRVIMNALPALLLILQWKKWRALFANAQLWLWMSIAALACIPLVGYASTAVDRIALYLTPLQIVVYSRLPVLWQRSIQPALVTLGVVMAYGLVLFVWLNYASHAPYWLPYRHAWFE